MQTKKATHTAMKKRIMRRVYYAFGIRIATHTITLHVGTLLVAGFVLTRLVHVAAVFHNMETVQVGDLTHFVAQTLLSADVLTLVVTGVVIFTLLSLPLRIHIPRVRNMHTA